MGKEVKLDKKPSAWALRFHEVEAERDRYMLALSTLLKRFRDAIDEAEKIAVPHLTTAIPMRNVNRTRKGK